MNIKRMADEYRDQVKSTGLSLQKNIQLDLLIFSYKRGIVGQYRTEIKRWHSHLQKALGSEKDLKELQKVWELLVGLSKLCGESTENLHKERRLIVEKIQNHMEKFLQKLPRLIEKSLTRAVRESGIRLR